MSKCIACLRMDLKAKPQYSKLGMGVCPLDPSGTFVSIKFERVCKSFQQAPAATVAKRETWAKDI